MVYWSVYDCVAAYTCECNLIQKHLYLFSIEPIKRYVTICGGLRLFISVCGGGYLSTENNEKTIRNVEQLTHAVMCGNMRWSFSFHLSVWMWILLHFGSQTLVELHASRTNEDVRMYIGEFILVDIWIHCCTRNWTWSEWALEECWFIYTRNKGMRNVIIALRSQLTLEIK